MVLKLNTLRYYFLFRVLSFTSKIFHYRIRVTFVLLKHILLRNKKRRKKKLSPTGCELMTLPAAQVIPKIGPAGLLLPQEDSLPLMGNDKVVLEVECLAMVPHCSVKLQTGKELVTVRRQLSPLSQLLSL